MYGAPPPSRALRVGAALIAAVAVIYTLVPFSADRTVRFTVPPGVHDGVASSGELSVGASTVLVGNSSCGAALIDAWYAQSPPTGWFGYAPLTSTPLISGSRCRRASQQRLWRSGWALVGVLVLVVAARAIERRPGFGLGYSPGPAT